ncbi:hypothetical protein GCM10012275_53090 [Longimycelium tulufanense]|uniref:Transcriptional regulator WhiB n=1 Tax=Longimycelium tulufanense TaxID=907463 RepID=A0A8J3FWB7_9PSEU|nr:WhiB family transcriptional regulator [Longimycelium tulufanense]GGM75760.1 hypothetical protein GCM10012275_53090 [Longimycelium tulufanense]
MSARSLARHDAMWLLLPRLAGARRACAEVDPDVFFAEPDDPKAEERTAEARAVCTGCPVRARCLDFALATGQYGVWGGTTEEERRELCRQRAASRPMSALVAEAIRLERAARAAGGQLSVIRAKTVLRISHARAREAVLAARRAVDTEAADLGGAA